MRLACRGLHLLLIPDACMACHQGKCIRLTAGSGASRGWQDVACSALWSILAGRGLRSSVAGTECSLSCLQGMAAEWPALRAFGNNHGWDFPAFEQSLLNEYYGFDAGSKITSLPDRFNWKGEFHATFELRQSLKRCRVAALHV